MKDLRKTLNVESVQDYSDGYHTFEELYNHRMFLFSIICNTEEYNKLAWKSKLHDDGTIYDNYFIVGISTLKGDFTYHYDMKHWNKLNVKVLEHAPEWDGHTSDDITRLESLLAIDRVRAAILEAELMNKGEIEKKSIHEFLQELGNEESTTRHLTTLRYV